MEAAAGCVAALSGTAADGSGVEAAAAVANSVVVPSDADAVVSVCFADEAAAGPVATAASRS